MKGHKPGCMCPPCYRKRTGALSSDCPKLSVQVSHEEAALVRQAAESDGLRVNAWLRRLIRERFKADLAK